MVKAKVPLSAFKSPYLRISTRLHTDVKQWFLANKLLLNADKSEVILVTPALRSNRRKLQRSHQCLLQVLYASHCVGDENSGRGG